MIEATPSAPTAGFRVRPAAAGDLASIRAWMPQAFRGSPQPELFVATDASGAPVGAASLRIQRDFSGQVCGSFLLFVQPAQRRRGCGRCLLQVLQDAATLRGASRLLNGRFLEDGEVGAAFCLAMGLVGIREKLRFRVDLAMADDFLTARYRLLQEAGAIPAEARIGPLELADPQAVAVFAAEQMGCFPEDVLADLNGCDRQASTVIHLEQRLVGVQLTRTRGNTSRIEIKAVAPDLRRGWVNLALMFRSLRERRKQGIEATEFEAVVGEHNDTVKMAQRLRAVRVGRSLAFGMDLPARPDASPRQAVAVPQPPEVLVTGDRAPPGQILRARCSAGFPELLDGLGIALALTRAPSLTPPPSPLREAERGGLLVLVRADNGALNAHCRRFDRATGLAIDGDSLALATQLEISEYHNAPAVAARLEPADRHDACYLPRGSHVTGDLDIQDLAWANGELWFASARFSCLGTRDDRHNFAPRWRPPFVTALAAEDRCHLSGLCLAPVAAAPHWFATVWAPTDTPHGWRLCLGDGLVMDAATNDVVLRGLAQPCSPRWFEDRLWLLEGGTGTIGVVDRSVGRYDAVAKLPGFARGLAFHERYAFVGLSRTALSDGLADRKCGIWVVDINSGRTAAWLELEGPEEVVAVQVLAGRRFPELIPEESQFLPDSFVLPDAPLGASLLKGEGVGRGGAAALELPLPSSDRFGYLR